MVLGSFCRMIRGKHLDKAHEGDLPSLPDMFRRHYLFGWCSLFLLPLAPALKKRRGSPMRGRRKSAGGQIVAR